MAIKLTNITTYSPKSSDRFFFDNNIWMYLFCPLGNYNKDKQRHYSSFLRNITSSRSTIFVSSMILSEFANRNLRMDFDLWKVSSKTISADYKKDYVGSQRYKDTVGDIITNINNIIKICDKTSDNFSAIDLNKVYSHFHNIDFNDSYYLEQVKLDNIKFVTDDSDFTTYSTHNVEIFTLLN